MGSTDIIREFIQEELVKDKINRIVGVGDDLINSGIIDSLGILKLLAFLESRFSIHIADEELIPENFDSVASINSLIRRKKNAR